VANTSSNLYIPDPTVAQQNTYVGGARSLSLAYCDDDASGPGAYKHWQARSSKLPAAWRSRTQNVTNSDPDASPSTVMNMRRGACPW